MQKFKFSRLFKILTRIGYEWNEIGWISVFSNSSQLGRGNEHFAGQISGEARTEGAKRPNIESEARTKGKARDKAGGGVWGEGSVSPSPENV